jgi:anti-sigma B factor antagonist
VSRLPADSFEVVELGGLPVVMAPEEIDVANSGQFRLALLSAAAQGPTIVVDLSRTEFCDSSGLSVLVRALRRARSEGGELRLVVSTHAVRRIIAVTGVGTIFSIFASLDEALASQPPELATSLCPAPPVFGRTGDGQRAGLPADRR